jgi:hypothetical protein
MLITFSGATDVLDDDSVDTIGLRTTPELVHFRSSLP